MKLLTTEIEKCGECCEVEQAAEKWKCTLKNKIVPNLWGEIPKWCPLPSKRED